MTETTQFASLRQASSKSQNSTPESVKTKLVDNNTYTGVWPFELPDDQRRDTSCPMTLVKKNQVRIKRWPDIIGVGFPKCGTGTMAFLDCHSDIGDGVLI